MTKEKGKGKERAKFSDEFTSDADKEQDANILDDTDDGEAQDLKRIGLRLMEEIADIHERIRKYV